MATYRNFSSFGSYGWVEIGPARFARTMKAAGEIINRMWVEKQFDVVAFSGSSGSALAFYLAGVYAIPIIYVRKEKEECHGNPVECNLQDQVFKKYLIVDDFICSGKTMMHIINSIKKIAKDRKTFPLKPMGVFCYSDTQYSGEFKGALKKPIPIYTLDEHPWSS